jgi:hypothetical protein
LSGAADHRRSIVGRAWGRLLERRDPKAPRLATAARPDALAPDAGAGAVLGPPIFIIGCQRSGTSLLRRIVDSHSSIACPPESKFILPATEILRDRSAMAGLDSMGYGRAQVVASLSAFVRAFFDGYARAAGKTRWADKTPNYVACLPELWELFGPEARFVLLVRNGLDVAYSLSDPHRHFPAIDEHVRAADGSAPVGAARFWSDQNELMEAFRRGHREACFRLKYEELTTRPEETLRPMFEFLGEQWEPAVLDYGRFEHHSGFEDPDVKRRRGIEPNSGRAAAWPAELRRAVGAACEPALTTLGYTAR